MKPLLYKEKIGDTERLPCLGDPQGPAWFYYLQVDSVRIELNCRTPTSEQLLVGVGTTTASCPPPTIYIQIRISHHNL